jgi:hypothetical protein
MKTQEDMTSVTATAVDSAAENNKEVDAPCVDGHANILAVQREVAAAPQIQMDVIHHFSKGLYARELHIPKGTILVGKTHRFENLNIISKGEISVYTDEGIRRISAPCTIVSPPGTKRVGYAHEDTVWTSIHATNETDVDVIEKEVIAEDCCVLPIEEQIVNFLKGE